MEEAAEVVEGDEAEEEDHHYGGPPVEAGEHLLGLVNIYQFAGVELGIPEEIKNGVREEDKRHKECRKAIVRRKDFPQRETLEEEADEDNDGRHRNNIACRDHVKPQSVPQDREALPKRSPIRMANIDQHKDNLLCNEDKDKRNKKPKEKFETHWVKGEF